MRRIRAILMWPKMAFGRWVFRRRVHVDCVWCDTRIHTAPKPDGRITSGICHKCKHTKIDELEMRANAQLASKEEADEMNELLGDVGGPPIRPVKFYGTSGDADYLVSEAKKRRRIPIKKRGKGRGTVRNMVCSCGSGKKFKRCCGKG